MTNPPGRLIAIGDVHGCVHALEAVIDAIAPTRNDCLVFLGDLIDHGPETRETLDFVIQLKERCQVILIQGNHEEMMFASRSDEQALMYWTNIGGATTLSSYRFGGRLDEVHERHWQLLAESRAFYETPEFIFTHANYLPDLPMPDQPGRQLRWALFDPREMHPHVSGKPVIVGHTEQRDGEILDLGFATCIDTACWRYGWLTAIELPSKHVWQSSRWGLLRDPGEASHREQLSEALGKKRSPELAGAH